MRTIDIQSVKEEKLQIVATIAIMDGETEVGGMNVSARTQDELDRTLSNIEDLANHVPTEVAKVKTGRWTRPTPPVKEEVVAKEPTAEELKAQEINAKEMELEQEVERARKAREVAELAQSDTGVADKLAELEALRGNTKQ